jgi:hypothetical protein
MNAVIGIPSASVNRQLRAGMRALLTQNQPGSGRPCGHVDQVGGLGHPGPVADLTGGVDRRVPGVAAVEGVDGVLHAMIDRVTEGESDLVLAAGLGEGVGGPGRVRPHHNLGRLGIVRAAAPIRRQRRRRLFQDGDVVGRSVAAGVACPQQSGQRLTAGDLGTILKRQQRVMPEGFLPGRGRVLLVVGVVDRQRGIDIDV